MALKTDTLMPIPEKSGATESRWATQSQVVTDAELFVSSEKLMIRNKRVYEVLAK